MAAGDSGASETTHSDSSGISLPLDINAATFDDWVQFWGTDSELPRRIVEFRTARGRFESVDDLRHVEGIGAGLLNALCDRLIVRPERAAPQRRASQPPRPTTDIFDPRDNPHRTGHLVTSPSSEVFDPRETLTGAGPILPAVPAAPPGTADNDDLVGGGGNREVPPSPGINLRLLVTTIVCSAVMVVAIHALHTYQITRLIAVVRERADESLDADDATDAMRWLRQFLAYVPGDLEATEELGLLLQEHDLSARGQLKAYRMLERVVRNAPGRAEARHTLVELAMRFQRWSDALDHLNLLEVSSPEDANLKFLRARCLKKLGRYEDAVATCKTIVEIDPTHLDSYVRAADISRNDLQDPARGKDLINQMVSRNPTSAEACLARARFRRQDGRIKAAAVDLLAAIRLAPDDLEVRLQAADLATAYPDLELIDVAEARLHLERLLPEHTDDPRVYGQLGQMSLVASRPDQAEEWFRRGLEHAPGSLALRIGLLQLQLQRGHYALARDELASIENTALRGVLAGIVDAHEQMQDGQWRLARDTLLKLRRLPVADLLADEIRWRLADCYRRMRDSKQEITVYRQLVRSEQGAAAARLQLARALAETGATREALAELQLLPDLPEAALARGRLLIEQISRQPAEDRDWTAAEQALASAEKLQADPVATRILQASLCERQGRLDRTRDILEEAAQQWPDDSRVWAAMTRIATRPRERVWAQPLIERARHRIGDSFEVRQAQIEAALRSPTVNALRRLADLESGLEPLSDHDRGRLLQLLGLAWLHHGRPAEAIRRLQDAASLRPDDIAVHLSLVQSAIAADDDDTVELALERLELIDGNGALRSGCARAAWLVRKYRSGQVDQRGPARRLLQKLANDAPSFADVWLIWADLCEAEGNLQAAADMYQKAFDCGHVEEKAGQRLVELLQQQDRLHAAERVVKAFESRSERLESARLLRLGSEIALDLGNKERALQLARQSVTSFPHDVETHLWLGKLLGRTGRTDAAGAALRKAIQVGPHEGEVWIEWIRHLVETERPLEADQAVTDAQRLIDPSERTLAMAKCHELLGRPGAAQAEYQVALSLHPHDPHVLRSVAAFYLRSGQWEAAETLLWTMVDPAADVPPSDRDWASRQLAGGTGEEAI